VRPPSPRREGLLLGASALAFFTGFYAVFLPVAPRLANGGVEDGGHGLALGAFGLASLAGRPLAGRLADRVGSRPVLAAGGLLLVASGAAACAVPLEGAAAAARALQGLAYVAFSTALGALVAGATPPGRRLVALAWSGVPANAAIALAPALVHLAAPHAAAQELLAVAGPLGVGSSVLAALASPGPAREPGHRPLPRAPSAGDLRGPFALAAASGAVFAAFTQLSPHALAGRAGIAFGVYAGGMILARLVGVRLVGPLRQVLPTSFLLAAAGLAALGALPAGAASLVGPVLVASGLGFQHPAILALHVDRRPPERHGRATATFYLGFDLGIGVGGALLGLALGGLGVREAFAIAAAVAIGAALLALRTERVVPARAR
jgi:MFS family permease